MPDEGQHETQNLTDYETLDSSDTLDGAPGDDPLDRAVVPPEHWSAAIRGDSATGESLDELLAEEEPDQTPGADWSADSDSDPDLDESGWDEAGDRAGRLIAPDGGHHVRRQAQLLAHDVGPDGGGASAEEAAVHITEDVDGD